MEEFVEDFDVIISGAGPAGCTAAMELGKTDLKVALIDKYSFPRDKICGDFVSALGLRELYKVNPSLESKLQGSQKNAKNRKTSFFIGNEELHFHWNLESITMKRVDFDNLLLEEVLCHDNIHFFSADPITKLSQEKNGVRAVTKKGREIKAPMILGCDGAHSIVSRSFANYKIDRKNYGGSVRAYFEGVENIQLDTNEVYVDKTVMPGYFWLFPLSETTANVGVGMTSSYISKHKINLKVLFEDYIKSSKILNSKLSNANMSSKVEGFGLPFFSHKLKISGDRFLLCGDAANLMDPSNGEGIMQAIMSGSLAAEQVMRCTESNDYSEDITKEYSTQVYNAFWKEMKIKSILAKAFANKPKIVFALASLCVSNKYIYKAVQKMM